ncbi:hypothetical protein Bbelb_355770 [Branchiostoma belcheri]|nr:hypothetical protein Bbelb_355770 [Branchiostoma belcheri]
MNGGIRGSGRPYAVLLVQPSAERATNLKLPGTAGDQRNAVYARPLLTFLEGPSYRSESFELHKILRAVRRGKFSAPAKFTPAPPTPSQSLASLDATLTGRRLNVAQTLHKLRWSGCKRFTSGHGVAGTVSGVEAAIHVGNELWFGVGIEVSERDQNLAISTVKNGPGAIPTFATAKPTLKQRRLQRNAPAKFGQCDRALRNTPYVYRVTAWIENKSVHSDRAAKHTLMATEAE